MICWQTVTNNLRRHYRPLSQVAKEVGSDWRHLNRLARGEVAEPKFTVGHKLLDLHYGPRYRPGRRRQTEDRLARHTAPDATSCTDGLGLCRQVQNRNDTGHCYEVAGGKK